MRISDWSSDVCSSDLQCAPRTVRDLRCAGGEGQWKGRPAHDTAQQELRRPAWRQCDRRRGLQRCQRASRHSDQNVMRMPLSSPCPSAETERSEEHTSELQSLMRISYAVFCLKKTTKRT